MDQIKTQRKASKIQPIRREISEVEEKTEKSLHSKNQ